jgi:uncharacterized protein YggE
MPVTARVVSGIFSRRGGAAADASAGRAAATDARFDSSRDEHERWFLGVHHATATAGGMRVALTGMAFGHARRNMEEEITMTDKHGTLNVTGTGKVSAAPDEAVIQLGVVIDARTAAEATTSNASATQRVIDAVSAQPNHSVTTTGLSVNPIFSYDETTHVSTIVGFRATNGVNVKTKVGYAGQIYDAGITAGATQSSGITFQIQNEAPLREEALRLAVENAHREAKLVAQAARVDLTGIDSIQIDAGGGRLLYRAAAIDFKATPVMPEDKTISASVQITYRTRA